MKRYATDGYWEWDIRKALKIKHAQAEKWYRSR
ncbi:hypothetical protein ISN45_At02g031690 [Arabidopsis thaliana x Arabidopsis arenosa]|uniref:Uncharacterized protein n=2 Tax=Arabidopsis TaxID=3701 RepID=A0A8T2G3Y2_ARASU|nr:hypothetical protein ISN45_At02g031690 [Arabidopsis thaliana x Arabidopsis arenosa]KAG7643372.1 hypothetical protein ISN44_As02g031890 [Arabidopsis suecica]